MATEEEEKRGFKVEDRRRFSAEGELKPEHQAAEPAEPAADSVKSGGSGERLAGAQSAGQERRAAAALSQHRAPDAEITFETFVVGLSTQALVHLGEIPDPHAGASAEDLPAAQQLIDIIGMLKQKTRGNLDREEEAMLDAILFELRMKYVERARRSTR
jgi:uncharacterized protein DUF1844